METPVTHPWETEGDLPFLPEEPPVWVEPEPGENPLYDLFKRDAEEGEEDQ